MNKSKHQYRVCCVPDCNSKSAETPDKLFFKIPSNQMKDVWLRSLGLDETLLKKVEYVCENHFDAQTDIENYTMARITGQKMSRFCLRKGAVPSVAFKENIPPKCANVSNKETQCKPECNSRGTQCNLVTNLASNEELWYSPGNSPVAKKRRLAIDNYVASSESSPGSTTSSESKLLMAESMKSKCLSTTYFKIEKDPKYYLGLTIEAYELVKILSNSITVTVRDIYIVLKKVSLDLEFKALSDDFGLSISQTAHTFKQTLYKLSSGLKKFIFWPTSPEIEKNLPIPFRRRYSKVVSIIDCFEIIIEKPENALHQSLTWSEYKKNNTIKYLISCTPDGLINFISPGFGGRASDMVIVSNCSYLDNLTKNMTVMADRGFKGIETELRKLGCLLVRPPSVTGGELSAEDVLQTKRIASLRIHVERVINRVRNFKSLSLHSCVNTNLVQHLDEMVHLACCLINTQDYIIKNIL